MKTRIFGKAIAMFLVLSLIFAMPVSASNSSGYSGDIAETMLYTYLLGIKDPDGADRTSWQTSAASSLFNIQNALIYKYTAFNSTELLNYLKRSNFFVIHTHGNQTSLKAVNSSGSISQLRLSDVKALNSGALSECRLAFIGACLVGAGGSTADNMVTGIYNKGARCVIGYKVSVKTTANYAMIKYFCQGIGRGDTILEALAYADTMVLAECNSDPGGTNSRLVLGRTGDRFTDRPTHLSVNGDSSLSITQLTDENGDVIGFFDRSKVLETNDVSYERGRMSNTNFDDAILEAYNIDTEKYELVDRYFTEDTGLWTTIFNYKINNILTSDSIVFVQNTSGDVVSFSHKNEGAFENISVESTAINSALERLEDQLLATQITDYSIVGQRLVLKDRELKFCYSIHHTIMCEGEEYEIIDDFYVPFFDINN